MPPLTTPADDLELELPPRLERALALGHPWVYRDHVPPRFHAPTGTWLRVRSGDFRGWALWDATSPIALRLVDAARRPDADFIAARVRRAHDLREPLRRAGVTGYRWLFGEADGLPGVTVDRYGDVAVIVTYADAADTLVPDVGAALRATAPLSAVVQRLRGARGEERLQLVSGVEPPPLFHVEEYGVRLRVELATGQKTGLFLDHRENRRWLAPLATGRSVLNLFAYTGAFSVHAALGGASRVTSVDVAAPACDAARENFRDNGLDPGAHDFVAEDCITFLERAIAEGRRWELVICDPPSFAKNREQLRGALKAYERLFLLALRATAPDGYLAAASCTSQVSPEVFREVLVESARRAHRHLQSIHEAGQPLDHPVLAHHPEGRYLKFVCARALGRERRDREASGAFAREPREKPPARAQPTSQRVHPGGRSRRP